MKVNLLNLYFSSISISFLYVIWQFWESLSYQRNHVVQKEKYLKIHKLCKLEFFLPQGLSNFVSNKQEKKTLQTDITAHFGKKFNIHM